MDAQQPHMRDRLDAGADLLQRLVGQRQRVAAGQDHLADFSMAGDVVERRLQRGARIAAPDRRQRFLAEAEPAVDGALVGRKQQHPVGMAMRQARHRTIGMVADRVVELAIRLHQLVGRRDDLRPDRIVRIVPVDQVEIGLWRAHLVVGRRLHRRRALAGGKRQGVEVAHMAHAGANVILPGGVPPAIARRVRGDGVMVEFVAHQGPCIQAVLDTAPPLTVKQQSCMAK